MADSSGAWSTTIEAPVASGPHEIHISTEDDSVQLQDVWAGEIWLCSGQSNMAMPIRGFPNQPVEGSQEAMIDSRDPLLRLFALETRLADQPIDDCIGNWQIATPETVSRFSAVGYYFGKRLRKSLNVPVALILAARSSSAIESWMPSEALRDFPSINLIEEDPQIPHRTHSSLYNGMIAPLSPYRIKGVLWYQGEANRHDPLPYAELLSRLIGSWREAWNQPDLPFYFAQIAPNLERFNERTRQQDRAVYLREAQLKTAQTVPNTGMVVTLDLGSAHTIHPPQKRKVADRFAYWALKEQYGYDTLGASGPVFEGAEFRGDKAVLRFSGMANGFQSYGIPLKSFMISGSDRVFHPAEAEANRDGTVTVTSDQVPEPVAVRYAWNNWTEASLFDSAGLPASSFRTDDWPWE